MHAMMRHAGMSCRVLVRRNGRIGQQLVREQQCQVDVWMNGCTNNYFNCATRSLQKEMQVCSYSSTSQRLSIHNNNIMQSPEKSNTSTYDFVTQMNRFEEMLVSTTRSENKDNDDDNNTTPPPRMSGMVVPVTKEQLETYLDIVSSEKKTPQMVSLDPVIKWFRQNQVIEKFKPGMVWHFPFPWHADNNPGEDVMFVACSSPTNREQNDGSSCLELMGNDFSSLYSNLPKTSSSSTEHNVEDTDEERDSIYTVLPNHGTKSIKMEDMLGYLLGGYDFDRYKRKKMDSGRKPKMQFPLDPVITGYDVDRMALTKATARATYLVRDLINTPACDLPPAGLQSVAEDLASMYRKGVVYDTGGLNLKPGASMLSMKKDMGGAAHALGLLSLLMETKAPVQVRCLIPMVENSIGSDAFRPGDVLTSVNGKTTEVGNTDAEGRLILADALAIASVGQPDLLLDFATLTGAARVALGRDVPPYFTNRDEMVPDILQASITGKDPLWQLPLWPGYEERITTASKVADLGNIPSDGGMGGAITAALYLKQFVGEQGTQGTKQLPWIHIDLYGLGPDGLGHAQGIRAMYNFIRDKFG
eukprot:scaffold48084_cov61-Attheya_sp.AAC.1